MQRFVHFFGKGGVEIALFCETLWPSEAATIRLQGRLHAKTCLFKMPLCQPILSGFTVFSGKKIGQFNQGM